MTPERWRQVEDLYAAACERQPEDRAAFLADAAGADLDLRQEVESLLPQNESGILASSEGPLDRTIAFVPAPKPSVLIPGTSLGPYKIMEPIGAGGMGVVYRARDPRLGSDVAI